MVEIPIVETDRLILRPFRNDDIDAYAAMCADPEVSKFLSVAGFPMDRREAWRGMALTLGHWMLRGFGPWALEVRESGAFVGRAGLYYPDPWPGPEVSYALARPHWGKGYATEAARAARDYAFDVLGWDETISVIDPRNTRSIRVAEAIGEKKRGSWRLGDLFLSVYALTRADYDALVSSHG